MNNINLIRECMRNDPEIIFIDKNSTERLASPGRILTAYSADMIVDLIKRMEEEKIGSQFKKP